jgi:peroxiredoxin
MGTFTRTTLLTLSLTSACLVLGLQPAAAKPGHVGTHAPAFRLQNIPGSWVSLRKLRGRKVVLVVGMKQKAAPRCKAWMKQLVKRYPPRKQHKVEVYQVVVVDKSWYIPRSLVLSKLKGFVGAAYHDRFLVEWYTVFSDLYRIPKSTLPMVLVIDEKGVVRHRTRETIDKSRWTALVRTIEGKSP